MPDIGDLLKRLSNDPRRPGVGWSPDFETTQNDLLKSQSDDERSRVLSSWLATYQPCLFGKIAARAGQIQFCFLTEEQLLRGDKDVQERIQAARRAWWARAYQGEQHAFVVHAIGEGLASARPDADLKRFAQRLAELYLVREPIEADSIYLEDIFLRVPGLPDDHLLRWRAGVNIFASAAERRWWQDHRIPGGLAFSVNSVGHMVKAVELKGGMNELLARIGIDREESGIGDVRSLPGALRLAMLTIENASEAVSGKATWLASARDLDRDAPACPVPLLKKLEGKNHCWYLGAYHTDQTIPSSYFTDDIERSENVTALRLDFTYLFHNSTLNPDHVTMGAGEQIRGDESSPVESAFDLKASKQWPVECALADLPELRAALDEHRQRPAPT